MYPEFCPPVKKLQGTSARSHHQHRSTSRHHSNVASRMSMSSVGEPIHFVGGQWDGQTVRAELHEIQKADLGRKYARVDRRPLDPPPVVLLKLFIVHEAGTDSEMETEIENYDEVQSLGLLCNVDLFPAHGSNSSKTMYDSRHAARPYSFAPYNPSPKLSRHVVEQGNHGCSSQNSNLTGALVGATFMQPVHIDYQGKKALVFVFADLAVKVEGTFILHYRIFDLFSKVQGTDDILVQAECYGGPFRIYSTKEFPGLQASTDLTKQLARYGIRLNLREVERRRRRRDPEDEKLRM